MSAAVRDQFSTADSPVTLADEGIHSSCWITLAGRRIDDPPAAQVGQASALLGGSISGADKYRRNENG